jgi:hypothetical protein
MSLSFPTPLFVIAPLVLGEMRHHVEECGQLSIIIKHKLQDLCCHNIVQTVRL